MNRQEFKKQVYVKPKMRIIATQNEPLLHTGSGNAGTIGAGGSGGDAKQGWFEEEGEESLSTDCNKRWGVYSAWEESTNE